MPKLKTVEEWAASCWDQGNADICDEKEPLTHSVTGGLCVACARAYARQVGEAFRDLIAAEFEAAVPGFPDDALDDMCVRLAKSIHGRPVEAP